MLQKFNQKNADLQVYIDGGRTATGTDAVEWAKRVDGYGVPVILPTSKAGDGVQTGFDLPVIRLIKEAVSANVVASGGALPLHRALPRAGRAG